MVNEHGRYVRDSKSKDDKQQSRFDKTGWIKPKEKEPEVQFTTVSGNEMVMCPFCLHTAKLSLFFVSTNKGISQGKAECPSCKNGMLMKSLYNDWGAEEYAQWVFDYRRSGFWQKCPFPTWKQRLYEIGWAHTFWTTYKELKGSDTSQSYFDQMNQQAEEYAKQWEQEGRSYEE